MHDFIPDMGFEVGQTVRCVEGFTWQRSPYGSRISVGDLRTIDRLAYAGEPTLSCYGPTGEYECWNRSRFAAAPDVPEVPQPAADDVTEWLREATAKHGRASNLIDELTALMDDDEDPFPDMLGYIEDVDPEIIALALTGSVARFVGLRDCTCPTDVVRTGEIAAGCPIHDIDHAPAATPPDVGAPEPEACPTCGSRIDVSRAMWCSDTFHAAAGPEMVAVMLPRESAAWMAKWYGALASYTSHPRTIGAACAAALRGQPEQEDGR